MKHRTTATLMLAVAIAAAVCHFASIGIDLRRRGFTTGEALEVIGTTLIIALVPGVAAVAMLRMWKRRTTSRARSGCENQIAERITALSRPATLAVPASPGRPR
jgi:predicted Kef-type K+ transport protein